MRTWDSCSLRWNARRSKSRRSCGTVPDDRTVHGVVACQRLRKGFSGCWTSSCARCGTTSAIRSIVSAASPWPRCSGSASRKTSIGSSSGSGGRAASLCPGPAGGSAMVTKKIPTFIEGLDDVLDGGFPLGHVVLVSGLPGTMKSTLSYSILHANARQRDAKCLYVSLEQTRPSLEAQMAAMGFDVEAVRADLHILDVGTIQKEVGKGASKPWMEFLRRTMTTKKDIDGMDLVVIDSLEALEVLAKFEDRRTELFRLFEWLRDLGATTLVLAEAASEASYLGLEAPQPRRDETFLADGIIELKMHPISDVEIQRRIRVQKMRGSHHKTGFSALE